MKRSARAGEPVGLLAYTLADGGHMLQVFGRPIAEYADDPAVQKYLNSMNQTLREILKLNYPGVNEYQVMGKWDN